jgi:hypothetical protein
MTTPEALAEAALYVAGAGPWKGSLWATAGPPAAAGHGGTGGGGGGEAEGLSADAARDAALAGGVPAAAAAPRLVSSGLVARLKAAGLAVHLYTLRDEAAFVPAPLGGDVGGELSALLESEGADGVFADYPATATAWVAARWPGEGASAASGAAAAGAGAHGPQPPARAPLRPSRGGGGGTRLAPLAAALRALVWPAAASPEF